MRILVTGSSGHLGEALVRVLAAAGHEPVGLDCKPAPFTAVTASLEDAGAVRAAMRGVAGVIHAATLHKPHIGTHTRSQFVATNVQGTLNVLEAALAEGVGSFVMTSSTSVFGAALTPPAGAPAAWVDETLAPIPKNIYGVTKLAAENLCELFARTEKLPVVVLRTARFFPEADDDAALRGRYADANIKVNELLNRRADIEDIVEAHMLALERAPRIGFGRYIVSATTPFRREDTALLRTDAEAVLHRRAPLAMAEYARRGWTPFATLDRVYDNTQARQALGWQPRHDFHAVLARLAQLPEDADIRSPLAKIIGSKGYHDGGSVYPFL